MASRRSRRLGRRINRPASSRNGTVVAPAEEPAEAMLPGEPAHLAPAPAPAVSDNESDRPDEQPARDGAEAITRPGEPAERVDGERGAEAGAAAIPRYVYRRTRRKPRPLGVTYHRVRATWLTLLVGPVMLLVWGLEAVRAAGEWLGERTGSDSDTDRFRRPAEMPPPQRRSVQEITGRLQALPRQPRRMSPRRAFYSAFGVEGVGMMVSHQHALVGVPHLYPSHFRPVLFEGADGERIAGLQAMHNTPGPMLIVVHGLLTTKHFDYIRQIATRAYFHWGFHVAAIDLRGWGQTAWTSEAPSSAGWAEGRDIVEVARALKADPLVTSVGTVGYSLGGCAVLNAARHASRDPEPGLLDGGVLAFSAPTDVDPALRYIGQRPDWKHPYAPLYLLFHTALRTGLRARGYDNSIRTWWEVTERIAAPWYGVSMEEYTARASAVNWADEITVPTLDVHASDDFVVPVQHAYRLREAARENRNVEVMVVDHGTHCAFSQVDRRWYYSVIRRWFEYWAQEGV